MIGINADRADRSFRTEVHDLSAPPQQENTDYWFLDFARDLDDDALYIDDLLESICDFTPDSKAIIQQLVEWLEEVYF